MFGRARWRLVIPVKDTRIAKSRLQPPAPLSRPDLARAIALDTLEAVCRGLAPADVLVVTSDTSVTEDAAQRGCTVVTDPGEGLNRAIRVGLAHVDGPGTALAVLLGDLPALRAEDLLAALDACARYPRAVIPDHNGSGTVLLTGSPGLPPLPRFGSGSAARHAEEAVLLTPDLPRLRQDVDDLDDLTAAARLGVGPRTARVLAEAASRRGPST